jgi:hypothetical protein
MTMLPSVDSDSQNDRECEQSSNACHTESGDFVSLEDVESARLQYDAVITQWKNLLQRKTEVTISLHLATMREVCKTEEMSPFLLGRLAELSSNEYLNMILLGMSRRIHNECRVTPTGYLKKWKYLRRNDRGERTNILRKSTSASPNWYISRYGNSKSTAIL